MIGFKSMYSESFDEIFNKSTVKRSRLEKEQEKYKSKKNNNDNL